MKIVKEVKAQSRHPVQIAVLVWWILACVLQLVFGPPAGSIAFDTTTRVVTLVLLLIGSGACLAGSLINDVPLGFSLELWGWVGICVLFVIYGYLVLTLSADLQSAVAVVMFPAFIVGGILRIRQIRRAQRRLKQIARHEIDPT